VSALDRVAGYSDEQIDEVITGALREDQEPSRAVDVERVVHRTVGVHLVDEADLDPVPDGELPIDPPRVPVR
jgi:hypothetical protein